MYNALRKRGMTDNAIDALSARGRERIDQAKEKSLAKRQELGMGKKFKSSMAMKPNPRNEAKIAAADARIAKQGLVRQR